MGLLTAGHPSMARAILASALPVPIAIFLGDPSPALLDERVHSVCSAPTGTRTTKMQCHQTIGQDMQSVPRPSKHRSNGYS